MTQALEVQFELVFQDSETVSFHLQIRLVSLCLRPGMYPVRLRGLTLNHHRAREEQEGYHNHRIQCLQR